MLPGVILFRLMVAAPSRAENKHGSNAGGDGGADDLGLRKHGPSCSVHIHEGKMQLEIQGGGDLPDFFLLLTLRLPCLVRGRSHARAEGYQKLGRSSTTTMRLGSADHV